MVRPKDGEQLPYFPDANTEAQRAHIAAQPLSFLIVHLHLEPIGPPQVSWFPCKPAVTGGRKVGFSLPVPPSWLLPYAARVPLEMADVLLSGWDLLA